MSNDNSEHKEFEDLIDKAIDEMFVSRAEPGVQAQATDEGVAKSEGSAGKEAAKAPGQDDDFTITWDQTPADDKAEDEEEESEEGTPRMAALRPVYQAMLSLDWEITPDNIAAVEKEFGALRDLNGGNYHLESAVKLALITCKYLRASKVYATPLATRYLHEAVAACEVFLSERTPGKPSPDALTNDLLGLYNEMKTDANRLRAVALKGRAQAQERQASTPPPRQQQDTAAPPPKGANPILTALKGLWDSMEQIRSRLRGASAKEAPFADAIDGSCASFQVELEAATSLASAQRPDARLDALEKTAQELEEALMRFKKQLAELRSQ